MKLDIHSVIGIHVKLARQRYPASLCRKAAHTLIENLNEVFDGLWAPTRIELLFPSSLSLLPFALPSTQSILQLQPQYKVLGALILCGDVFYGTVGDDDLGLFDLCALGDFLDAGPNTGDSNRLVGQPLQRNSYELGRCQDHRRDQTHAVSQLTRSALSYKGGDIRDRGERRLRISFSDNLELVVRGDSGE